MCFVEINVCIKCISLKNLFWGGVGGILKGLIEGLVINVLNSYI